MSGIQFILKECVHSHHNVIYFYIKCSITTFDKVEDKPINAHNLKYILHIMCVWFYQDTNL